MHETISLLLSLLDPVVFDPASLFVGFGLLLNKSSSKTSVTNKTDVFNTGLDVSGDDSIAANISTGSLSRVSVVNTDLGAVGGGLRLAGDAVADMLESVRAALGFGRDSLGFAERSQNESLGEAFRFARESLGTVERTVGQAQRSFEDSLDKTLSSSRSVLEGAVSALDDQASGGADRLLKFAGIAVAGVVIFALVNR